jgi:hypothetical protein
MTAPAGAEFQNPYTNSRQQKRPVHCKQQCIVHQQLAADPADAQLARLALGRPD